LPIVHQGGLPVAAVGLTAVTAISALAAWRLSRQEDIRPVARLLVGVSPASQLAPTLGLPTARRFRSAIALSPDGQTLAFVGRRPDVSSPGPAARQLYL